MMEQEKIHIFIVDNEIEICSLLKDFFDFIGYESAYETDGEKALEKLDTIDYDLIFIDLRLENISGIEILKKSKIVNPLAEVIIITGYGSEETIMQTLRYGASSYIQKPISFSEIKVQTEEALAKRRFNIKTAKLEDKIADIEPALIEHFKDILYFNRLSDFLNLTIDIDTLADSILDGISNLVPGYFYSFLFFDEINKEMVIFSHEPISDNNIQKIKLDIRNHFETLVRIKGNNNYVLRITAPKVLDKKSAGQQETLMHVFVPILIENTINGLIGISGKKLDRQNRIEDILRNVSMKISSVLTNATVHRNTKMLALTDGLTGLLNHRAFHDRLRSEYERFRRYGSYLSLIVADYDNLKVVNDNYGHPVGDEVIKKIGDILRDISRETDVLTRYGGDEFVLLLPQTDAESSYNMAERIRRRIEDTVFTINDEQFRCTISIGVATAPDKEINSPEDLLEKADHALYESKRSGRNKVSVSGSK